MTTWRRMDHLTSDRRPMAHVCHPQRDWLAWQVWHESVWPLGLHCAASPERRLPIRTPPVCACSALADGWQAGGWLGLHRVKIGGMSTINDLLSSGEGVS